MPRKQDETDNKARRDYAELYRTLLNQSLKPRPQTDEELIDRINEYFDYCETSRYTPSFEALVAYCGFEMSEVMDICSGNAPGLGSITRDIFQRASEAHLAITYIRLGDGTHKSAPGAIFESKQPFPGGGWQDAPKIVATTRDLLKPENGAPFSLAEMKKMYLKGGEVIDAEPITDELEAESEDPKKAATIGKN